MSTKTTIAYDSTYHIYRDSAWQDEDGEGIFLELNDTRFDISASHSNWPIVTVFLNEDIIEAIQRVKISKEKKPCPTKRKP